MAKLICKHHYLFENKRSNGHRIWFFQKMWVELHRREFSGYRAKNIVVFKPRDMRR